MHDAAGSAFPFRTATFAAVLIAACLAPVIGQAARPTISGTPPTTATVGVRYTFAPVASDADGNRLIFWIQARPSWASFDWRTGVLTGIPAASNVGVNRSVIIGVSDSWSRNRVTWLPSFDITVRASGTTNRAPTISGTPSTTVIAGQPYSFTPTASDPDGNTLTFSINQRPAWASFNTATGRLNGTPTAAQVGAYSNIAISVTDGALNASLAPFSINVVPVAFGSATLTWTPPTTRTDGSALTNLAGYRVRWGTAAGSYPNSVQLNNPGLATYVVGNLAPATYYFVVQAFDSNGLESTYSNVAQKTIQP